MPKEVGVAAAVLVRQDGRVLLGQRAADTFYPGYWEFPGGKLEAGESAREALARELREELGIEVCEALPWITRRHAYEHARVTLHFFIVDSWQGELNDHVHAALAWEDPQALTVAPMLPANGPILKSLTLPTRMAVTRAREVGLERQLADIDTALQAGLRLIQIREPGLHDETLAELVRETLARAREHRALVVLNADAALAERLGADGVHLKAERLARLVTRPALPWVGASCHQRSELEHAATLGLDYAVVGAVKPTQTHPEQAALGWPAFTALIAGLPMPVFAIGGLAGSDMASARRAGAHGIAMLSAAWEPAAATASFG